MLNWEISIILMCIVCAINEILFFFLKKDLISFACWWFINFLGQDSKSTVQYCHPLFSLQDHLTLTNLCHFHSSAYRWTLSLRSTFSAYGQALVPLWIFSIDFRNIPTEVPSRLQNEDGNVLSKMKMPLPFFKDEFHGWIAQSVKTI